MSRRLAFLIALVPLALFALWHFLSPTQQLQAAQRQLIQAIAQKDAAACAKLIHPDYADAWNFTAADWPAILQDLRTLSPLLEMKLRHPTFDAASGVVDTSLEVKSAGGPAASILAERAVELKETTRCLWKRQPWRPWSWQLLSVQNPALEIPPSYRPGSLSSFSAF